MAELTSINTRKELAIFLGVSHQQLTHILYGMDEDKLYTRFEISKKSGGKRKIDAPIASLKYIQQKLSDRLNEHIDYLEENYKVMNKTSHGFKKGKSIISNAESHRNKKYILNIDLENFFPTIHFGRVRGFFIKNRYFKLDPKIATIIAQIACYKGSLPQGAPTSPIISNLICNILDNNISKLTRRYQLTYTRYADDLSFSTNVKEFSNPAMFESFFTNLEKIINESGFKINGNKTRLQCHQSRQTVTGLTVNKKINTKKEFWKNTRAMADNLYTSGSFQVEGNPGTIEQLHGRFSFVNQLDWYNKKDQMPEYDERIPYSNLNSREKEYQKFIYYRDFFHNDKPLLITEGKTDIRYLKAALKSNYLHYPNLISKKHNSEFDYNVLFLDRFKELENSSDKQKKWSYFFGIESDGADALNKIIELYVGSNENKGSNESRKIYPGYWNFFNEKKQLTPTNPVIIILDNEKDGEKPLKKFIPHNVGLINSVTTRNKYPGKTEDEKKKLRNKNYKKIKNKIESNLKEKYYSHIFGNLYLLVIPNKDNLENVEMEELFDKKLISSFNKRNYEGMPISSELKLKDKDRFSDFVFQEFNNINFEKFRILFDAVNQMMELIHQEKI